MAQLAAAAPLIVWEIWHFLQPVQGLAAVTWIPSPSVLAPALSLWNFVSGDTDTWTPLALVAALIVGAVAVYGAWRTRHWRGFLLLWLLLPLVSALILSLRVQIYVDRYFAYCQFPLLIFLAVGIIAIRNRPLQTAAGAVIIVLMAVNVYRLHTDPLFAKKIGARPPLLSTGNFRPAIGWVFKTKKAWWPGNTTTTAQSRRQLSIRSNIRLLCEICAREQAASGWCFAARKSAIIAWENRRHSMPMLQPRRWYSTGWRKIAVRRLTSGGCPACL